ncbi:Energy-coupling factor ABC transporter ATP-binding protein [Candidatus Magnetomoraceae bacterium gMMP-1]
MNKNNQIIYLKDINFYRSGMKILDGLNFKLGKGEKIGLIGHNGAGKTSLFHIIIGLEKPVSGSIEIFGKHVSKEKDFVFVRQKIGLLFQDADDQLFSPTVMEDVAFGPLNLGKSPEEAKEIAIKTLDKLGLNGFENRITYKLSGGEKKLVSLATVLSMNPEVLLLDEPTTGLDEHTKDRIIKILVNQNLTYIFISHEPDFLARTTERQYIMKEGRLFEL